MSPAEDPLFAIFDRSLNPMLLADDERNYVRVNKAACNLVGYSDEQMTAMRIDDLALPQYRPFMDDIWGEFLERGGTVGMFEVLCADGSTALVEFNATARVAPGLHLSIFIDPSASGDAAGLDRDSEADRQATDEPVPALTRTDTERLLDDDERTVMTLLALGQDWYAIADDLDTDVATVRALTESSMAKLGARTRVHAVSIAMRAGEIRPGDPAGE